MKMNEKINKREMLQTFLTTYLFAIEIVKDCRDSRQIRRQLIDLGLDSGLCTAIRWYLFGKGIYDTEDFSNWIYKYIPVDENGNKSLYLCHTPRHVDYAKVKTLKALYERAEVLKKELHLG